MNAKVKTNLGGLNPRAKLAKFKSAITACGLAPALVTVPTLAVCLTSHDATKTVLDTIDSAEIALTNLRVQRDQLMGVAMGNYAALGSSVQTVSQGDPAVITFRGFEVAADGSTTAPAVGQIMSLVLTHGDVDGAVDLAWHRDRSAISYELQSSADPVTGTSWAGEPISTKSSATLENKTIGSKLWVRVRGIGKDGPGLWSDPASIIVT